MVHHGGVTPVAVALSIPLNGFKRSVLRFVPFYVALSIPLNGFVGLLQPRLGFNHTLFQFH